jgi:glycosyltransferase involved in cell wall biosynthesis
VFIVSRPNVLGVPSPEDPDVSVVIATRNGGLTLGAQLEALIEQRVDGHFEVIVADNGSTDDTVDVASTHMDRLDLRVVDASACLGSAFARNVGTAVARAPRIVFIDDDDVIAPGYLAAMGDALDRFEFVAARIDNHTLNPAWRAKMREVDSIEGLRGDEFHWAAGCALGVTRRAFDVIRGFDPRLTVAGEDVDFCLRMHEAGVELHLVTGAVVHKRLRTTRRALFDQSRRYAIGTYHFSRLHGRRQPGRPIRGLVAGLRLVCFGRDRSQRTLGVYLIGRFVGRVQGTTSARTRWAATRERHRIRSERTNACRA